MADNRRPLHYCSPLLSRNLEIDLAAEKLIAAEKGMEKIAVEVKSFIGESLIYDFHTALGQMLNYQINIDIQEPDRMLILAIPDTTFAKMLQQPFYEVALECYNVHFLVFDKINQQIIQWKK